MKLKTVLLLLTGFCVGVMMQASIVKYNSRTFSAGGEIFIVPLIVLLVWFGWMLRGEYKYVRRFRNGTSRRK